VITWSGIVVTKLGGGRESACLARRAPAVRKRVSELRHVGEPTIAVRLEAAQDRVHERPGELAEPRPHGVGGAGRDRAEDLRRRPLRERRRAGHQQKQHGAQRPHVGARVHHGRIERALRSAKGIRGGQAPAQREQIGGRRRRVRHRR